MKFDRLFIRHWDTWEDGKRSTSLSLPVKREDERVANGGEPIDLMKGVDADCPTKPFGGAEEFDWSPDGKEIAYTAQLGDDFAWSTDLNIYLRSPVSRRTGEIDHRRQQSHRHCARLFARRQDDRLSRDGPARL